MSAPLWLRAAAVVIPHLPAGRFRAAQAVSRIGVPPFVARMPADLGGARFLCDLHDDIARDVFLTRSYEPLETQIVRSLLQPGGTFIDAGANWGYFTLLAADLVGAAGRLVAIEPDPRHFATLQQNVALNAFMHVTCVNAAAAAARGTLQLRGYGAAARNRGVSSLHARTADAPTFDVAGLPLDDVVQDAEIDEVSLIKIDVEGAEGEALAGMRAGLSTGRYRRILIEWHPAILASRGVAISHLCGRLAMFGYKGWNIDRSSRVVRAAAYGELPQRVLRAGEAPDTSDPWPHMLWCAPGVAAPAGIIA